MVLFYLFMLGHGVHQPCGQSGAVGPFPQAAGAASALSGFLMMVVAFGMGAWLGHSLAAQPDSTRALNDLAWILAEARHDYAAALTLADRGLALEPDNVDLLDTRGAILMHLPDRLAQARADFERCAAVLARTSPGSATHARMLWQLGRICAELDDATAARRALQEAMEIDGRHSVFTADERPQVSRLLERLTSR